MIFLTLAMSHPCGADATIELVGDDVKYASLHMNYNNVRVGSDCEVIEMRRDREIYNQTGSAKFLEKSSKRRKGYNIPVVERV